MVFSKYAIESMGFSEYPQSDSLEVHFGIIKVYSLQGLVFRPDSQNKLSSVVPFGDNCTVAVAQSINEASKSLTGDVFTDDEAKWISDIKATPPFLLIYFRESVARELNGGHRLEKDGYIYTYDAFPEGKIEIRNWENDTVPGIVTSLTVHLSTLDKQVDLVPLDRSVFGTTKEGKTLFDIKITGSANLTVSSSKSLEEINSSLEKSENLFSSLTKDMCRHFYTALNESDRLKKFLGYFLFIERFTHSTYKLLSYGNDAYKAFKVPERVEEPAAKFFEQIFCEAKNLSQRFHWCSILAWETIDDQDVVCFLEIKKIRDKLAHGEHIEDSDLPVEKAKALALKLLGTRTA